MEGRKSKGRLLTRVSFRYLSGERSVVLLDIDFDLDEDIRMYYGVREGEEAAIAKVRLSYQK